MIHPIRHQRVLCLTALIHVYQTLSNLLRSFSTQKPSPSVFAKQRHAVDPHLDVNTPAGHLETALASFAADRRDLYYSEMKAEEKPLLDARPPSQNTF